MRLCAAFREPGKKRRPRPSRGTNPHFTGSGRSAPASVPHAGRPREGCAKAAMTRVGIIGVMNEGMRKAAEAGRGRASAAREAVGGRIDAAKDATGDRVRRRRSPPASGSRRPRGPPPSCRRRSSRSCAASSTSGPSRSRCSPARCSSWLASDGASAGRWRSTRSRSRRCSARAPSTTGSTGAGPRRGRWMRRLDHSMIFLLIAGTVTPFALLVVEGTLGDGAADRGLGRGRRRHRGRADLGELAEVGLGRRLPRRSAGSARSPFRRSSPRPGSAPAP